LKTYKTHTMSKPRKKNTLENNIFIAEFMGCKTTRKTFPFDVDGEKYYAEGLHYHDSWGWLMSVAEKIARLCDESPTMMPHGLKKGLRWKEDSVYISVDIEIGYKAILEFINWYNKLERWQLKNHHIKN